MLSSSNKNPNKDLGHQTQHDEFRLPSFMRDFDSNISTEAFPGVSVPKPDWKPNQHQLQMLEELFNGGTVNPSLNDIKQISTNLQDLGKDVQDADVYTWFQSRKFSVKRMFRNAKLSQGLTQK